MGSKHAKLKDVQKEKDDRHIPIDKVGVKDIRYPIVVLDKKNKEQHTIASINMYVNLPHQFKGTHMSRFIETLNKHHGSIALRNMGKILNEMKTTLEAQSAHMEVEFPYFIEKEAPVSKEKGLMEYRCRFIGSSNEMENDFLLEVKIPVNSLCPCSKEMSKYGAHNQRSLVTVQIRFKDLVWIEDLITIVESSASSPVYSLLKREDEKFVTERAYENPAFVEDIVRNVAEKLEKDENIRWFSVEAENFESIHNHNAYAFVERKLS